MDVDGIFCIYPNLSAYRWLLSPLGSHTLDWLSLRSAYQERSREKITMNRNEPKGSFIRWQLITITQLTYSVNLILGLAVGVLGFQVALLLNDKFNPIAWQKYAFSVSMFLLVLSLALGIWCVINRLRDFRATAKAARMRERKRPDEDIQPYRDFYKKLGEKTWYLFWWQVGTFGVGIFCTILSVLAFMSQKLL